jgi:amino-acid N-acetyltransferase
MIRNAQMKDVKPIYDLLHHFADEGLLLGRSLSSLYDQLRDFQVFIEESEAGDELVGVCALHICWENLAEIRSLAVKDTAQGKGVGRQLVEACLIEAESLGINEIFTLTYQPGFFVKYGFQTADKKELPHKVWSDCINCPKFPDCNEEAMIWKRSDQDR